MGVVKVFYRFEMLGVERNEKGIEGECCDRVKRIIDLLRGFDFLFYLWLYVIIILYYSGEFGKE